MMLLRPHGEADGVDIRAGEQRAPVAHPVLRRDAVAPSGGGEAVRRDVADRLQDDVVPRDLWITGMEERDSVLKLTGSAFSTTAVSDLMSNLRSSGRFKSIDIVISRQDLAKTPSMVTFEVTCRFES